MQIVSKVCKSSRESEETYTAKFESRKWISIAVVLAGILSLSCPTKFFGTNSEGPKIASEALYLIVDLYFELTREVHNEFSVRDLETRLVPRALHGKQISSADNPSV